MSYVCDYDINIVIKKLEEATSKLMQWFSDNYLKANVEKCHFLLTSPNNEKINIRDVILESSTHEKLLGITFDNKLTFNHHIIELGNNASRKLHVLGRACRFMNLKKRRILMKIFFSPQFNYCPLVWMCHSRMLNNKINKLHERALRIVYKDTSLSLKELLEKDISVTIPQRN